MSNFKTHLLAGDPIPASGSDQRQKWGGQAVAVGPSKKCRAELLDKIFIWERAVPEILPISVSLDHDRPTYIP